MPFTHLDRDGNAHMVDVGDKSASRREAVASARVSFPPDVYAALREQHHFSLAQNQLRVARNQMFAEWTDAPQDGDEIAFIPPVSGG